jgi:hypothetical protein
MTEDMQAAWLEIEQMLGEATREEFDVFLRTWQRAVQATRKTLAQPDFWEGYVPEPVKPAQQEPVLFLDWYDNAHWGNEDFKAGCWRAWDAALAQRTWVGLTDEEIQTEWVLTPQNDRAEGIWFGRRIEAKLKEMNT